jgi:hypothetical protein
MRFLNLIGTKRSEVLQLLLSLGVLSACQNPVLEPPSVCVFPDDPKSKAPEWICNPAVVTGKFVTAIGLRKSINPLLTPMCKGRTRLSMQQTLEVSVKTMLQQYVESSGQTERLALLTKATTEQLGKAIIHGTSVKRQVTSPKGMYYCLMAMEKGKSEVIEEAIDKAVDEIAAVEDAGTSMTNMQASWQKFIAEKAMKERLRELEEQSSSVSSGTPIKPSYRYIDNRDGTVTDNRTGLIWLKNANCFGNQEWETAKQSAANLAHGQCGLRDGSRRGTWRLPTEEEWEAMVDDSYKKPALANAAGSGKWNEGEPFSGVQTGRYWSSTAGLSSSGDASGMDIGDGRVYNDHRANTYYVWPVRGRRLEE